MTQTITLKKLGKKQMSVTSKTWKFRLEGCVFMGDTNLGDMSVNITANFHQEITGLEAIKEFTEKHSSSFIFANRPLQTIVDFKIVEVTHPDFTF